jgi:FtsH-binding integral membrane protein
MPPTTHIASMKQAFKTLSSDQQDIVFNAIFGMERERAGYWKIRQWMSVGMAFMALCAGWSLLDVASQDSTVMAFFGFAKWLMVLSAMCGFGMWLAFMHAERKDQQSTQECIAKAFQLGLNPLAFRREVVTLANAACDKGLVR